jgi:hypothetical protein
MAKFCFNALLITMEAFVASRFYENSIFSPRKTYAISSPKKRWGFSRPLVSGSELHRNLLNRNQSQEMPNRVRDLM